MSMYSLDYPLQASALDVSTEYVMQLSPRERDQYVFELCDALLAEIELGTMSLKTRVSFAEEMRDLRRLLSFPATQYLGVDERTLKRNVLCKGSPGGSHTHWSRHRMWRMVTSRGALSDLLSDNESSLLKKLRDLFDPNKLSKSVFRKGEESAVKTALAFIQMDVGVGTAFPPFHAKFLADRFLPKEREALVIDPCAGWGGRLLGSLCVDRSDPVTYVGIDPEEDNREAYEGLNRRINVWLRRELPGPRFAEFQFHPFEDWIASKTGKSYRSCADLVITSPPYFDAEVYNPDNPNQSAVRYSHYEEWRCKFFKPLIHGSARLLKRGGVLVLNVANTPQARALERDARRLAADVGLASEDFFKLAMSRVPGTRNATRRLISVNGASFKYEPVFVWRRL